MILTLIVDMLMSELCDLIFPTPYIYVAYIIYLISDNIPYIYVYDFDEFDFCEDDVFYKLFDDDLIFYIYDFIDDYRIVDNSDIF